MKLPNKCFYSVFSGVGKVVAALVILAFNAPAYATLTGSGGTSGIGQHRTDDWPGVFPDLPGPIEHTSPGPEESHEGESIAPAPDPYCHMYHWHRVGSSGICEIVLLGTLQQMASMTLVECLHYCDGLTSDYF